MEGSTLSALAKNPPNMEKLNINDHILLNLIQVLHTKGLVNAQEVAAAADQNALTQQVQMNNSVEADASLREAAKVLQQYADMLNQIHPWPREPGRTG